MRTSASLSLLAMVTCSTLYTIWIYYNGHTRNSPANATLSLLSAQRESNSSGRNSYKLADDADKTAKTGSLLMIEKEIWKNSLMKTVTSSRQVDNSCDVSYIASLSKQHKQQQQRKKIIFYMGNLWEVMGKILQQFDGCEYSNCIYQTCNDVSYVPKADAVVFAHDSKHVTLTLPTAIRQRQLWFVFGVESPAYERYRWSEAINNFNGTMTYVHNSVPTYFPYGMMVPVISQLLNHSSEVVNYAKGKKKGAYAYVSNCDSSGYNRLKTMRELSKYIDVDIFGKCTGNTPCPRLRKFTLTCESVLHSQYRFYLAFENSLCTEYITEKFWKTLETSNGYFIPVALGGLSVSEYTNVAPPDSFIHAYNFSSIAHLGRYLQMLMTNDEAFNRYHQWRQKYTIIRDRSNFKQKVCDFCKVINYPEMLKSVQHRQFADEWNSSTNCKRLS